MSALALKGREGVREFARIMELEPLFGRDTLALALEKALNLGVLNLAAVREYAAEIARGEGQLSSSALPAGLVKMQVPGQYNVLLGLGG
ncbi:MAG: hypothetical protein H5U00_08790 [Clostridia bacterium]|nr:hypothetical protein [Clostridia bacterium]